ncbi:element excision factor XisH family protein [Nostoc mirabile]|uniref:element excision factor XisH family protein n=1 Tax=Nostoc mirabile TaxID=2907820 RepID=UPI0027E08E44|nr:element excision factor XisH family protein [Nostoc mirabile]
MKNPCGFSPGSVKPVRDRYHENVKNALIKDGWTITDDPFHLKWGKRDMYVDRIIRNS